jgi:hypothetical protein
MRRYSALTMALATWVVYGICRLILWIFSTPQLDAVALSSLGALSALAAVSLFFAPDFLHPSN